MTIRRDHLIAWANEQADTITAILEPEYDGIAEELFDESDAAALHAIAAMLKGDTDEWRPITTAPMDGTPILLYASEHGDDYLAYGRYERYNDGSEGWLAPSFASRSGKSWTTGLNPTLWRPLCWPKGTPRKGKKIKR